MHARKATLYVILFFALLTAIGLLGAPDYGLPCDEPAEQVILQENLKEYALVLLGEESEAVRYYNDLGIVRISESIERDHGQSAYYPAAPLLLLQAQAPALAMTLWHGYTWLWFMVGVISLYGLLRGLGASRLVACAGALLLYLSPRFFAEGHYNNKDVVLLSLTLLTLVTGWRLMAKVTWQRALVFSLAGALATNTKIVGIFVWGLIGLSLVFQLIVRKAFTPRVWFAGGIAILSFLLFYWLLTPAAWVDPASYLQYLIENATGFSRWTGVVLFQGVLFNPTRGFPLPRSYLPLMILYTVSPITILLAAAGQIYAAIRILKRDSRTPMLLVLTMLWLVPMAYVIIARPLMYNGWRHFYFLFAGIAAMAGLGLAMIAERLQNHGVLKRIAAFMMAAVFLLQGFGIYRNHPYQYAYYNQIAPYAQVNFELDYWLVSTVNAMRRLILDEDSTDSSPLILGASDPMSYLSLQNSVKVLTPQEQSRLITTSDADAPYLLYNTTYAAIYDVAVPEGYTTLFHLESYGTTIVTIYRRAASAL